MLLKYSNGWGHLIMSVITMAVGVYLVIGPAKAIGAGLIATVTAAWFVPGSAKQVSQQVTQNLGDQVVQNVAQAVADTVAETVKTNSQPLPVVIVNPQQQQGDA